MEPFSELLDAVAQDLHEFYDALRLAATQAGTTGERLALDAMADNARGARQSLPDAKAIGQSQASMIALWALQAELSTIRNMADPELVGASPSPARRLQSLQILEQRLQERIRQAQAALGLRRPLPPD